MHWGKAEVFQQWGVPVPVGVLEADLGRLSRALSATGARRLVVLGDVVHAVSGLTPQVIESVAVWRQSFDGELILIRGNHDRHLKELPRSWRIDRFVDEYEEAGFVYRHEPAGSAGAYAFCGHEHPMFALGARLDRVRVPCFQFTRDHGVLPAFSEFTRGRNIERASGDRIYLATPEAVVAL